MKIPHVDVKAQYAPLIPELKEAFARSLETGQFIFGPEVKALEGQLAAFDRESTLGLVRLYFGEFRDALGGVDRIVVRQEPHDLESDLNSSLDALFGPLT